jgi:hypothetical protein
MWFDQHPLSHFFYRPPNQKMVFAEQIPYGYYVRPEGHVEWLKKQSHSIPVFLQETPPAGFGPLARRFPIEEVEAAFGSWQSPYWASGPAYMLAWAILQGYTEIHVYGIHLATEAEYREQRPNWEFLLGRFLGLKVDQRTENGVRIYEGNGHKVVLPVSCPILTHGWRYAYQPKPPDNPLKRELQRVAGEQQQLLAKVAMLPRWKSKGPQLDRLRRLKAIEEDLHVRLQQQSWTGA